MEKFGLEVNQKLKEIIGGKEIFYKKDYSKVKVDNDDDLPMEKPLKFAKKKTIIVRSVFQEDKKLYPQIYLNQCLYKV